VRGSQSSRLFRELREITLSTTALALRPQSAGLGASGVADGTGVEFSAGEEQGWEELGGARDSEAAFFGEGRGSECRVHEEHRVRVLFTAAGVGVRVQTHVCEVLKSSLRTVVQRLS